MFVIGIRKLEGYDKGYIEAALDTDGSIGIYHIKGKNKFSPRVKTSFYNNNIDLLWKIAKILGKGRPYSTMRNVWQLDYHNQDSYEILTQIELVVKEKKRFIALEIIENKMRMNRYTPKLIRDAYKDMMNDLVALATCQ